MSNLFWFSYQPDVTAPGVDIIAAYTGAAGPTESKSDKRRPRYITESGTSMSCPHVSGIVGLLKTLYPSWSPAAIRSAIITTGTVPYHIVKVCSHACPVPPNIFSSTCFLCSKKMGQCRGVNFGFNQGTGNTICLWCRPC